MITYQHPDHIPNGEGSLPLIAKAAEFISAENWCALFKNECGLGFQPLDNADIHKAYCEQCIGELDYIHNSQPRFSR